MIHVICQAVLKAMSHAVGCALPVNHVLLDSLPQIVPWSLRLRVVINVGLSELLMTACLTVL